ncbi:right-handed parallel beta-helix repeat-containing protein [bacterium]|nr:right-handed parallel beta-helix repeat-containing protein [bacterium]
MITTIRFPNLPTGILLYVSILCIMIFIVPISNATDISGTFDGEEEWTVEGGPYVIVGNTTFSEPSRLEIESGTTIEFQDSYTIIINGLLLADGVEGDSIIFRSNDDTRKGAVRLNVSNPPPFESSMTFCKFERLLIGVDLDNGFTVSNSRMTDCVTGVNLDGGGTISDCLIDNSENHGIIGSSSGSVVNSVIQENLFDGMYFYRFPYVVDGCTIVNNYGRGIYCGQDHYTHYGTLSISNTLIEGNGENGNLEGIRVTIPDIHNSDYRHNRNSYVNITNCVVLNNYGRGIYIRGAVNTYNNPDNYNTVYISLDGCSIEDNGNEGMKGDSFTSVNQLTENNINHNDGRGLYFQSRIDLNAAHNTVVGNSSHGLEVYSSSTTLIFQNSTFFDNGTHDLVNNSNQPFTAHSNWWNSTDADFIAQRIYDFNDNNQRGLVTFEPFLEAPVGEYQDSDFNQSGRVDGFDLAILGVAFGSDPQDDNWNVRCDLNDSERIDGFDLAIFATHFGERGNGNLLQYRPEGGEIAKNQGELVSPIELTGYITKQEELAFHEPFTMQVSLSEFNAFMGTAFDIIFDPSLLNAKEVTLVHNSSEESSQIAFLHSIDNEKGRIILGWSKLVDYVETIPASEPFLEITFQPAKKAGNCRIAFENTAFLAADGKTELPFTSNAVDISLVKPLPDEFAFGQNFPNPFNNSTTIEYQVPRNYDGETKISVYNGLGQLVAELVNERREPGFYRLHWDGNDRLGKAVGSGLYIVQMSSGSFVSSKKMLLLR